MESLVNGTITGQNNPVGKGSDNTTSYAEGALRTGYNAESYMIYGFDLSDIPDGATIVSVTCSARGFVSNNRDERISVRQLQMFSGNVAKGTARTISQVASSYSLDVGTWTVSELKNARIRVYAKRGTSNVSSNYTIRFYGATLTVVYDYNDKRYLIKTGASQWTEVSRVFEKTASGMVERSLETVMADIQNGKQMTYGGVFNG